MANERLRAAMLTKGLNPSDVAAKVGKDVKTVERWITDGRLPHRKNRLALAALLGEDEPYLWPDGLSDTQRRTVADSEVLGIYPQRSLVPGDLWAGLFSKAGHDVGILVHAGGFLAESAPVQRALRERAEEGVRVRLLLGDPESPEVQRRGTEEGLGEGVAFKVRNALALFRPLLAVDGVELRFHRSTLHNSLFIADDEMLVNTQIYGVSAPLAPVLHLRKVAGAELVSTYQRSFEQVWSEARDSEE
ncbi:XRE family transcriptional regulator [Catenulispora sp. NF23]|uniref:XRE family transcriptional regulator n=1 Tax=Catenulispora pinistramenti TaxID=2705254 RepID=UPI001BAD7A36|nr:XRE family transcriptional regulator [Catenulispora pinistramenti]MBS2539262.1 XRE family transcriptional regulator [Catenulispora pinistramenti]